MGVAEFENSQVIAGKRALSKVCQLQNTGEMKKILNGYIQNNVPRKNDISYKKKSFQPFVDERDHLGNLIDSEVRTELGGLNYIKKQVIFKHKKMEIREDIPRRWLEQVGTSEGGFSKGSFEGLLGLGGILAIPEGYKPNDNLAMSDGFKLINKSVSSPMATGHNQYQVSSIFFSFCLEQTTNQLLRNP